MTTNGDFEDKQASPAIDINTISAAVLQHRHPSIALPTEYSEALGHRVFHLLCFHYVFWCSSLGLCRV